jgi:hypothetical protein
MEALVLALVLLLWLLFHNAADFLKNSNNNNHHATGNDEHSPGQRDFDTITPSEKLVWHPCRYNLFCARLTVPLDYHRPLNASSQHPKVHLALLLRPGKHDGPQKFSNSPLLVNPGGPGGSGTMFIGLFGSYVQDIIDPGQVRIILILRLSSTWQKFLLGSSNCLLPRSFRMLSVSTQEE